MIPIIKSAKYTFSEKQVLMFAKKVIRLFRCCEQNILDEKKILPKEYEPARRAIEKIEKTLKSDNVLVLQDLFYIEWDDLNP